MHDEFGVDAVHDRPVTAAVILIGGACMKLYVTYGSLAGNGISQAVAKKTPS
jgi:hypothetical protein